MLPPGQWTKASASGMNGCVAVLWRKATASAAGNCVEVGHHGDRILLRDTKLGDDSPVLSFTRTEFEAFTRGVRDGEFDLPPEVTP